MKILHVITRLVRGGAQRVVLDLCCGQKAAGHHVLLASGEQTGDEGSLWPEAESLGITLIRVPGLVREAAPFKDFATLGALRTLVREHKPDVVHAHTSKAGVLGCIAARKESVQAVVFSPHGHVFGGGAKIPGVPERGLRRHLMAAMAKRGARHAHAIVAPNDAENDDAIALGLWPRERTVVVPNGVNTRLFAPQPKLPAREKTSLPREGIVLGVVARLTQEKGVDVAISALPDIPGAVLVVAGDGPERAALEALAAAKDVANRVHWLGMRDDIAALMPAFDMLLVPSRSEAHGMAAAEAMACGVPVIASAVGGLRSLVIDGKTGVAVPPGDTVALARAALGLIGDDSRRRELATAGRAHIEAQFSHSAMQRGVEALYRRLLGKERA